MRLGAFICMRAGRSIKHRFGMNCHVKSRLRDDIRSRYGELYIGGGLHLPAGINKASNFLVLGRVIDSVRKLDLVIINTDKVAPTIQWGFPTRIHVLDPPRVIIRHY